MIRGGARVVVALTIIAKKLRSFEIIGREWLTIRKPKIICWQVKLTASYLTVGWIMLLQLLMVCLLKRNGYLQSQVPSVGWLPERPVRRDTRTGSLIKCMIKGLTLSPFLISIYNSTTCAKCVILIAAISESLASLTTIEGTSFFWGVFRLNLPILRNLPANKTCLENHHHQIYPLAAWWLLILRCRPRKRSYWHNQLGKVPVWNLVSNLDCLDRSFPPQRLLVFWQPLSVVDAIHKELSCQAELQLHEAVWRCNSMDKEARTTSDRMPILGEYWICCREQDCCGHKPFHKIESARTDPINGFHLIQHCAVWMKFEISEVTSGRPGKRLYLNDIMM